MFGRVDRCCWCRPRRYWEDAGSTSILDVCLGSNCNSSRHIGEAMLDSGHARESATTLRSTTICLAASSDACLLLGEIVIDLCRGLRCTFVVPRTAISTFQPHQFALHRSTRCCRRVVALVAVLGTFCSRSSVPRCKAGCRGTTAAVALPQSENRYSASCASCRYWHRGLGQARAMAHVSHEEDNADTAGDGKKSASADSEFTGLERDARHMRRALQLAARGLGRTRPNPAVGCIIVDKDGVVVGEGFHPRAGEPHAEVRLCSWNVVLPGAVGHSVRIVVIGPCK